MDASPGMPPAGPSRSAAGCAWLDAALDERLGAPARAWLAAAIARIAAAPPPGRAAAAALAIGAAARQCGSGALAGVPAPAPGWDVASWTVDQAARVRLLRALPAADPGPWLADIDRIFAAGSLEELVAFYRGLPCLQHPARLAARAAQGVRHASTAVFDAIALDNPYPARHLDEGAWNQLVLKALFNQRPTGRILGRAGRANPALSRMLIDYARERRAARRHVPDDLWQAAAEGAAADQRADLDRLR